MRSSLALILILFGALLSFPASVALWEQRTLGNEDQFVQVGQDILDEQPVQRAIARTIAGQIEAAGGIPRSQRPLNLSVEQLTLGVVQGVSQSEVGDFALRGTYQLTRRLADLDARPVQTQGDQLVFDLRPAVRNIVAEFERVDTALQGRIELPPDTGRIVITESGDISLALDAFRTVDQVAPVLIVLPLFPFALALLIAPNRGLALFFIGATVAGGAALRIFLLEGPVNSLIRDILDGQEAYGEAGVAIYETLVASFARQDVLVLIGGLVTAGVGFVSALVLSRV